MSTDQSQVDQQTTDTTEAPPAPVKANERPKFGPPRGHGHGPMGGGPSGEKAVNFGPSFRRLLGHLRPEIPRILAVVAMILVGTAGTAVGPVILGRATDILFTGYVVEGTGVDFNAIAQVLTLAVGVYVAARLLTSTSQCPRGVMRRSSAWIVVNCVQLPG